ncbi:MAG TPA: hypothetical protein VFA49_15205 [Chloroflexota bacterium]|nr:hypothetical protein [Chloroflexota bacterium]
MRWLRWLPSAVVLGLLAFGPGGPSPESRIGGLASAAAFRLLDWETVNLADRAGRLWHGLAGGVDLGEADADALRAYFARQTRTPSPSIEAALERAVSQTYTRAGLSRSEPLLADRLFPPVLVALSAPPNVLVISPRTELRVAQSVVLQALSPAAQEQLESSADSTGVSSLVAPIGGLATYPSMVLHEDAPERVLASVAHEWLHQYLIFYPLGAGYWQRQETREINETAADLVGQEVGRSVAEDLGLQHPTGASPPPRPTGFDFRLFMRQTRLNTEHLLAAGKIEEAEAYMRAQRDELQRRGYQIRKLNQAYFALYGSYGEGFAASPTNPIPDLLRQLRNRSASLAEFIFRVRGVTTVSELRAASAA